MILPHLVERKKGPMRHIRERQPLSHIFFFSLFKWPFSTFGVFYEVCIITYLTICMGHAYACMDAYMSEKWTQAYCVYAYLEIKHEFWDMHWMIS